MNEDIEELWHTYHQRVFNYVRFRVRDPHDAEDIAQTVFLRAISAMRRGKGATKHASGWLWRITNNAVVDYYRGRGKEPQWVELDALIDDEDGKNPREAMDKLIVDGLTPHERVEQSMAVELVRRVVDNLPTCKQMDAMHMRLDGYDNEEIAVIMQSDVESVRALHTRARAYMRVRLKVAA